MRLQPTEILICLVPVAALAVIIIAIIVNQRERRAELAAGGSGVVSEVHKQARGALINAILGIVFFGIVLEPFALYRAGKARKLAEANHLDAPVRATAETAQKVAIGGFCLWVLIVAAWVFFR